MDTAGGATNAPAFNWRRSGIAESVLDGRHFERPGEDTTYADVTEFDLDALVGTPFLANCAQDIRVQDRCGFFVHFKSPPFVCEHSQ